MGEIFKSPLLFDVSKIPKVSLTNFVFSKLREHLPETADQPWLVDTSSGKQILFGQVEESVKKVASALAKRGFGKGDFLHYVTYDIVNLGVLNLAVWTLGGAVRGGFHKGAPEEIARQMKEIKCKFVALDSDTAPNVKKALASLDFECVPINMEETEVDGAIPFEQLLRDDGKAFPEKVDIDPEEDILLICNTSGSTGFPKGVIQTHFSCLAALCSVEDLMPKTHDHSQLVTSYNYAISNVWNVNLLLMTGNTMFYMSRFIKEKLVHDILNFKPARLFFYPYIAGWFVRTLKAGDHDFSFVKELIVGGAVLDPTTAELLEEFFSSAKVNQIYASTETLGNSISLNGKMAGVPFYGTSPDGERLVTNGFLLPMVEAKVTALESGEPLGRNAMGRLHLRSPTLTKGYLVPGAEPDRSDFDEDGWFDTGDLVFFDDLGQVYVRGKASFTFKYFNHFVNPDEIEAVLQEHPSVHMSCVIGVPNAETNHLARALVVLKRGLSAKPEELIARVAQKLPLHKHLHGGLEFVDSLPENRGGKLDRINIWKKHCRMN